MLKKLFPLLSVLLLSGLLATAMFASLPALKTRAANRMSDRAPAAPQVAMPQAASAVTLFRDDFSGAISSAWTILNEDAAYYTPTATYLELRTNSGDLWQGNNTYKNLFVITNPTTGDFQITVRLNSFSMTNELYEQFALVAYDDDDNYARADYGYHRFPAPVNRRAVEALREDAQNTSSDIQAVDFGTSPFYLRLRKVGVHYALYYSADGTNFIPANHTFDYCDGTPAKLGFVAMADPSEDSIAQVDWFEVTTLPDESNFSDEFTTTGLDPNWLVMVPNKDSAITPTVGGYLRLVASPNNGGSDYWYGNNYKATRVLQRITGDWLVETRLAFDPPSEADTHQGAGILLCYDQAITTTTCSRIIERYFNIRQEINVVGEVKPYTAAVTYIRLWKRGDNYTGWYSSDGYHWTRGGSTVITRTPTYVGLISVRNPNGSSSLYSVADFDYFHVMTSPLVMDDFDDNTLDPDLWREVSAGSGPYVNETNQRLEITLPATSTGSTFSSGYEGVCRINGDFDMQVDYELLTWPAGGNGVRLALDTVGVGVMERMSNDGPNEEYYTADFGSYGNPGATTTDVSGTLRIKRSGDTFYAYYRDNTTGNWVQLFSHAGMPTGGIPFALDAWSHDSLFGDQEVKIAFDNFILWGEMTCAQLTPDRSDTALPGQVVAYTHTLTNTGSLTDTFNITHHSSQSWTVDYNTPITLAAYETATVVVSVTVPANAISGTLDTTVVTATSQTDANIANAVTDTTTVSLVSGVAFSPNRSKSTKPDTNLSYTHILTNTGNSTDTFDITHHSSQGWTVNYNTPITLAAGKNATVVVSVTVPADAISGTLDTTVVTATSQTDANIANAVTDTTTVNAPNAPLTYTLGINIAGKGTVNLTPPDTHGNTGSSTSFTGIYTAGTVVTMTAVPTVGWQFEGWSGDGTAILPQWKVQMDDNKVVTATFKQQGYTIYLPLVMK